MGTNVLQSIDQILSNVNTYGQWSRFYADQVANSTTAALTTCGYTSAQRFARTMTVPSLGTGVTGAYLANFRVGVGANFAGPILCGLEVNLGSLTVSTNSFSSGNSMPSRIVNGGVSALQLASLMPMLVVSTTLTATTPVLTITYTNQAGTGSRTATMTMPTSPTVQSAFPIAPHLQGTDTGVQSVTNLSISTGSAGVLNVYGFIPLGILNTPASPGTGLDPIVQPLAMIRLAANDKIAFYKFISTAVTAMVAMVTLIPDTQ